MSENDTPPWMKGHSEGSQPPVTEGQPPVTEVEEPPVAEAPKVEQTQTGSITDPVEVEKARVEAIDQSGGHETVTVTVPKAFQLRLTAHEVHMFKPGVQEMPRGIAEHWYAKANGVKIYQK
jgi:hypothetical protein